MLGIESEYGIKREVPIRKIKWDIFGHFYLSPPLSRSPRPPAWTFVICQGQLYPRTALLGPL